MTANDSRPEFRSSTSADGYLDIEVVCDEAGEPVIFVRGELDRDTVPLLTGCLFDIAGMARDRGSRLYLAGCSAQ